MKRILNRRFASLLAIILSILWAPFNPACAQRYNIDGTPIIAAGSRDVPVGTVLQLTMEDRLNSKTSLIGDRFRAVVSTPIVDASGRTLLLEGTAIEGRVTNVEPAKWRRRSGIIGIAFDNLWFGDGGRIPLRGYLVPADPSERRRIDDEGNIRGGGSTKKTIVFIGGGTGAGAAIGVLTAASVLTATGIGAAVGVTAALLAKGEDVTVRQGDRFGLELVQPLRLTAPYYGSPRLNESSYGRPLLNRTRYGTPTNGNGLDGRSGTSFPPFPGNSNRPQAGSVAVYDVKASRSPGLLTVLITAETPTNNWQIYTNHQFVRGDTLEVRLRGVPSANSGYRQLARIPAPPIVVQDPNNVVRNVVVYGSNGSRQIRLDFNGAFTPITPTTVGPIYSGPTSPITGPIAGPIVGPSVGPLAPVVGPSDGSSIYFPPPGGSQVRPVTPLPSGGGARPVTPVGGGNPSLTPTGLPALATRVYTQLQTLQATYAADLNAWRNPDGTYDFLGTRRPTVPERQLLEGLTFMLNSANSLRAANLSTAQRREFARRLRDDYQVANQNFTQVRVGSATTQQWQAVQRDLRALIDSATS